MSLHIHWAEGLFLQPHHLQRAQHSVAEGIRAEVDITNNNIKGKVLQAEQAKVHTMLVVGNRDLEAGNVSVRIHGKGNLGAKPRAEVVADIIQAVKERRA